MPERADSAQSTSRLSVQQVAVLRALRRQSPLPTTILRDVRAERFYGHGRSAGMWKIGEPVGAVLRRLEKRGLVTGESGSNCKDWWISDAGLEAPYGARFQRLRRRRPGAAYVPEDAA